MASIQGIYLAFFGRPADPLGLAYWEEQTNGGADLSVMLNALSGTEEYQSRFVGMSDAEVIESIYQALFGREPEAEGLAHFLEALANGTQTLGSIAVNILDGAQGTDLAIIENKIAAAEAFTASLDTPEEIAAYSGDAAADFGRAFINQVTEDPETVPTPEEVQEQINNDLPDYTPGEAPAPGGGGGGGGGGLSPQQQFIQKWIELDKAYYANPKDPMYYDKPLNLAKVELANDYVAWLKAGNAAITTIVQTRVDGIENPDARQQSLHDNILGELADAAIADRFKDVDPRSVDAKAFGTRPWSSGNDGDNTTPSYQKGADFYQAAAWDLAFGVKRETINFPEVVTVKGPFTIGGVEYSHIVRGTDGTADKLVLTDQGEAALGFKPYMVDVETIENSHLRPAASPWVADIDLSNAMGVKEVWTDFGGAAKYLDLAYYSKASQDTVFGIEDAIPGEKLILVRFADSSGPDTTAHFALKGNAANSYIATGSNPGVENFIFDVHAGNAGSIGFGGNEMKSITVNGDDAASVKFLFVSTGLESLDASHSAVSVYWGLHEGSHPISLTEDARILGGSGNDHFDAQGSIGNLTINGGAGMDFIRGGTGNDTLTGGDGADTFAFHGAAIGHDTITDFVKGTDSIDVKAYGSATFNIAHTADASIITSTAFTGSITVKGVTDLAVGDFIFA